MNIFKVKQKEHEIRSVPVEGNCLAKTRFIYSETGPQITRGCDVYTHLWVTCRVIQILQEIWHDYPFAKLIPPEAQWLAALHDIGKVTPAFLCKIYKALGEKLPWTSAIDEREGGHSRSSEIILDELYGSDFARLAANHHGGAFWKLDLGDKLQNEILGGNPWQDLRIKIINRLKNDLHLPDCDLRNIQEAKFDLILGSVTLADWISSAMEIPFNSTLPSAEKVKEAIYKTGLFPFLWSTNLDFHKLFGFYPNPLQVASQNMAAPGNIYVIESGMGSGKTEAALAIAYQLLQEKKANGLYFAMPTKLTSEKIFDRLNDFLQHGIAEGISIKPLLIHGDSWLDWDLAESDEDGNVLGCGQWFQTKKRALLAPFSAGTVDQALMAVINVRHRALRAFALAGKIVIFDEVHSYDSYTGTLINALIKKISDWGGTVIILSATLTAKAKASLLGLAEKNYKPSMAYPLISSFDPSSAQVQEISIPTDSKAEVILNNTFDEQEALREACRRAEQGEQVLWIENTVKQAQKTFSILQTACAGFELGLIHSRFPAYIRQKKESYWVQLLGKNGRTERTRRGRILVATQVLEQSVDVDADFLVTRLAPVDMMMQRIGRLWRHKSLNSIRPASAKREAWGLIPEAFQSIDTLEKNTSAYRPYNPYWMYRSFQEWQDLKSISLPDDIRPLLEIVYADVEETGATLRLKQKMLEQKEKLEKQANISQGSANKLLSDEFASTRCSDFEEVQLLLIHKGNQGFPLHSKLSVLFADTPIALPLQSATKAEKTAAVRQLQQCMIRIPIWLAPEYDEFPADFLNGLFWIGTPENRPIRVAYVDDSGELLTLSGLPASGKRKLFYHQNLGYYQQGD